MFTQLTKQKYYPSGRMKCIDNLKNYRNPQNNVRHQKIRLTIALFYDNIYVNRDSLDAIYLHIEKWVWMCFKWTQRI